MNFGGTLLNTVVRLVVLFATLALVYLFILKPILDTTESVSNGISGSIQNSIDSVQQDLKVSSPNVTQQKTQNLTLKIKNIPPKKLPDLNRCISRAAGDFQRINRCASRLTRK